ncbi:MAG: methionyl-tRNA formyltransferase [Chlamydiae bacterium]|nr:methionyl-tRNA formyltransferase [Chlamydiota bacterium]
MKIVFFGTSAFASAILKDLIFKSFDIVAVVTRPDKPQGRSLQVLASPVKQLLLDSHSHIPVYQPQKASTIEFQQVLVSYDADLFFVVAYGEILKENILDLPAKGCFNLHASLLPKYRGAAPIQRCIMDGSSVSGITIIEMVRQMDAGDMLASVKVDLTKDMNFGDLEAKLLEVSFDLVPKVINNFDYYYKNKIQQDEDQVTFAAKISPQDSEILWTDEASVNCNKIRAFSPSPGAWCKVCIGGQWRRLKIFSSSIIKDVSPLPGSLLPESHKLDVACLNGVLRLEQVQLEGKKIMTGLDFLRGVAGKLSFNPESSSSS